MGKKQKFKTYLVDGNPVDVDPADEKAFLENYSEAIPAKTFTVETEEGVDTVDVPMDDPKNLELFMQNYSGAKPLYEEEAVVAEGQKKSPSGTAPEATGGFGESVAKAFKSAEEWTNEKAGVVASAVESIYPVAKGWLESIFESDKTESGQKADKAAGPAVAKLKVTKKAQRAVLGVSEIDRDLILKSVADMPEKLRDSKAARRVWIKTYSQRSGIDKRAVEQLYDQASNARKAIDQLEMEYYGEGVPITPEGQVTTPAEDTASQGQMKKFAKLYELARMYNYVGDHERAERAYSELERGLYAYGSTQMRNEDFSSRAPRDYVEQLQAPATQGLAYTKHLKGDKKGAEKITNILKVKGLIEPETELAQVGTGDIMQETPSVRSTYGFTGKRGYKLEDGEWVQESTPTPESQYLNDIAGAIEQYTLFGPMGKMPIMAMQKIGKGIEGKSEAAKLQAKGDLFGAVEKNLESNLAIFTGVVEGVAGIAGMATPVGAVFAMPFFQASNMVPTQVAEWMMPVSKMVRDYYAEKGEEAPEWTENIAVLSDFALLAIAHQGINKGIKYGKVRKQARTMDEFLNELSPETQEAAINDITKRWKASGENAEVYAEQVKNKLETEIKPTVERIQSDLQGIQVLEPYEPVKTPESLSEIPEGTEVEYMGEVGKIVRGEDMSWNVVFDNGRTIELPVKDKTNAVEKPSDLGVSILPEVPEEQIARATADAEQVGFVEYTGLDGKKKKYFVSLDRTGNPRPNGDFVLEVMPDGKLIDWFSMYLDKRMAADRKLAVTNAFLESKGLPKRTKNIEPWKEAERYQVEDGSIAYEPETPNAFGGKGQYVFYDNAGKARVITEQEYARMKEYGSPVKTKPYEGKTEEVQRPGEPAEQKAAEPTTANAAKRTEIRQGLIDARNKGILVSVDKGIIATTKRALGIETKKVPMSDMEIDAVMELTDAMAGVWKEATGKDNFYEAFISELVPVEKADTQMYLQNLKEAGGVLFQDVSNPVNVQSRVTLAVMETPQFKNFEGKQVNPQQIAELIKSRGKQIEKDIINYVLSQEKYRGQKRINYDEFRSDVDMQVMKLERLRTTSYHNYGMKELGGNEYYGDPETVILNSPLNHGEIGHFPNDFIAEKGVKTEWEIVQLEGSDTYVAMDKNRPSGLTAQNIQNYIGTAGPKASVEAWVNRRNAGANAPVNKGLFGHFRAWFDEAKRIFHMAELQSDYFQKYKASEHLKENLVPETEVETFVNKRKADVLKERDKQLQDLGYLKEKTEIVDGEEVFVFEDEYGNLIYEESLQDLKDTLADPVYDEFGISPYEYYAMHARNRAYQQYHFGIFDRVAVDNGWNIIWRLRRRGVTYEYIIERFEWETGSQKSAKEAFDKADEKHSELRDREADRDNIVEKIVQQYKDQNREIDIVETKKFKQERSAELAKTQKTDLATEQFIASQKIHEQRILREALNDAANKGARVFRFPTPRTLAIIERYMGSDTAPYDIVSGSEYGLDVGDVIEMGGQQYYVLEADRTGMTVAPSDRVYVYDRESWITDEVNNRVGEITYSIEKELSDMRRFTREEIEAWDADNEWMGSDAKDAILAEFDKLEDGAVLDWNEVYESVESAIERAYRDLDFGDEVSQLGHEAFLTDYGDVAYVTERGGITETLKQPDQYAGDIGDGWKENLSKDELTVVNKYEELNKAFKIMRGDVVEVTDGNGHKWLETKITEADKNNPIIAFQKSGAKVKGAIDFLNDNKATVSMFDGADVSTLVHEFTGHLGRRFLEKLSETDGQFAKDYEAIKQWAKVKDNMWNTRAEEMFARGFERYLRTGKAPTPELTRVFEMMAKWLKGIYDKIEGSDIDIEITPEVRDIFGRMLGAEKTKPKVGDTVMLEPSKKGGPSRKMVFTEEGWKQKVNDKEVKVGTTVQEMAADAWKEGPKEEAKVEGPSAEETAKALEGVEINADFNVPLEVNTPKKLAEAYIKAKADGSNPKLVEAVDNVIGAAPTPKAPKLRSFEEVGEETINLQGSLGLRAGSLPFRVPKDLWRKIKAGYKRYWTPLRGMPKDIFLREIERKGGINAAMTEVKFTMNDLRRAIKEDFGVDWNELPFDYVEEINKYLSGDKSATVPSNKLKAALNDMRQQIDNLSRTMKRLGMVDGDLAITFDKNMGMYLTRTYRRWREPYWAETVPEYLKNQAAAFIRSEHPNLTPDQVTGLVNHYLTAPGGPMDVIRGAKIGSKNFDILKERKDIPEALRLLWGEYKDPMVNYMTSIQKMATLIENHKFLDDLYAMGAGKYFFDKPTGEAYEQLAGLGSKGYSPLNDKFTTPEIKEALTIVKDNADASWLYRTYMTVNAYVKLGKTVGAPATQVRNFLSNQAFVIGNGHYLYPAKARQAWRTVKALYTERGDFAILDYIKDLQKRGVINSALEAGEIKAVLRDATTRYDSMNGFAEGSMLTKIGERAADIYQLSDTVYKVFAFEAEKQRYMDVGFTYKEAVDIAAENVRNTYPNYEMVPLAIQKIGKTPLFGTFVSFPSEIVRTQLNTWELAIKELKDPRTRRIGLTRIAGQILIYIGIKGVAKATNAVFGIDEKVEKALRRFQPHWREYSDFMFTGEFKDGVPVFIDFGNTDALNYIKTPINALLMNEDIGKAVYEATWAILKPYFSEEILAGRLLDVSRNKKQTGGEVYYGTDSMGDKVTKSVNYVMEAAQPGFVSTAQGFYKASKGEVSSSGNQYDLTTETVGLVTGQKRVITDVKFGFSMKSRNFARDWAETSKKYTTVQYQKKGEEEIAETKMSATQSRRELFKEMKKDYAAAQLFGYSSYDLEEIMKKSRVPRNVIDGIIYDESFESLKPLEEIDIED